MIVRRRVSEVWRRKGGDDNRDDSDGVDRIIDDSTMSEYSTIE
jgi:hypothetical protein